MLKRKKKMRIQLTNHEQDMCGPPRTMSYYAAKHRFTEEEMDRLQDLSSTDELSDYIGIPSAQTSVILEEREIRNQKKRPVAEVIDIGSVSKSVGSAAVEKEAAIA